MSPFTTREYRRRRFAALLERYLVRRGPLPEIVKITGTSGKGSVAAMLEAALLRDGQRTGVFTSPHLVSFRERIQVNRELISEADVVRLVGEMQPMFQAFPGDHHPTFFEVVTVMALKYFAGRQCDLVIWETGLGGRLDATNIVTPLDGMKPSSLLGAQLVLVVGTG